MANGVTSGVALALLGVFVVVLAAAGADNVRSVFADRFTTTPKARYGMSDKFLETTTIPALLSVRYSQRIPVEANGKLNTLTPRFEQLRPTYEKVAQSEGIPWQLLAAVHYREAGPGLSDQISTLAGEPLGTQNPDHTHITIKSFDEGLRASAGFLKRLSKAIYDVELKPTGNSLDETAMTLLAYNRGAIYESQGLSPARSPYVANDFNANYANMEWPEGDPVRKTGQVRDNNIGALTVYVKLLGPLTKAPR